MDYLRKFIKLAAKFNHRYELQEGFLARLEDAWVYKHLHSRNCEKWNWDPKADHHSKLVHIVWIDFLHLLVSEPYEQGWSSSNVDSSDSLGSEPCGDRKYHLLLHFKHECNVCLRCRKPAKMHLWILSDIRHIEHQWSLAGEHDHHSPICWCHDEWKLQWLHIRAV